MTSTQTRARIHPYLTRAFWSPQDKYGAEPYVAAKSQPESDMGGIQHAIGDDYIPQGTSFPPPTFQPKMVQPPPATKHTASAEYSADHLYTPQGDSYPPPTAFEGDVEDEWKGGQTMSSNSHGSVDRDSIQSLKREVITAADEAGQEFVRAEAERLRYGDPAALYGAKCAHPLVWMPGRLSRGVLGHRPVGCASPERPHPRNCIPTPQHSLTVNVNQWLRVERLASRPNPPPECETRRALHPISS
jgi:hypothetical protein